MEEYKNEKGLGLELEHLIYEKVKGCILRSKVKWAEESEKNTKYFFALKKRNAMRKNISNLMVNNIIISDPNQIWKMNINSILNYVKWIICKAILISTKI